MTTKTKKKVASDLKEKLVLEGSFSSNSIGSSTAQNNNNTNINPLITESEIDSPKSNSPSTPSTLDIEAKTTISENVGEKVEEESFFFTFEDFYNRNFYLSGPWSWKYYATVRGCENFHIYLWIAKDLAWAQDDENQAFVWGSLALAWCAVLAYHAIESKNMEELYLWLAVVLWLVGNFVWMAGEVLNNDDDYVAPKAAIIMETAIAWILFYHLVLKHFHVLPADKSDKSAYHRPGLVSRFPYFETWRDYENIHVLCWLGKDLCWVVGNQPGWIICFIPTLLIALDFVWVTFCTKRMMEDSVHYLSQLMWVLGNMLWALGNVFTNVNGDDTASDMFVISSDNSGYMRWLASWMLFAAYWPIIILHVVWIPMTYMGMFEKKK